MQLMTAAITCIRDLTGTSPTGRKVPAMRGNENAPLSPRSIGRARLGIAHVPDAILVSVPVRRIIPYHESRDFDATRVFYGRVLKLEEGSFGGGYIGFGAGQAQVVFAPPGVEPVLPDMGIDVGSREAVDAAHAEAMKGGHEAIYGPVDEPWGVRRFFVRDPNGVVISVLAHE
jgi:predicted enzyme related to lactoylglutathione lyase